MGAALDPFSNFDWAAHWRRLVETREQQMGGPTPGYWDRVAQTLPALLRADDPLLSVLEGYLSPRRTLLDVGAGTGRYERALADRLDWITAVEPSDEMRARIPVSANQTVVASTWEEADVAPADLVICSHVLYVVADIAPFLDKLEGSARERVFISLRDSPMPLPAGPLWEHLTGRTRAREVGLYDAYNLVRQRGCHPDLSAARQEADVTYDSVEAAVADARFRVGRAWREPDATRWLLERLTVQPDGRAVYHGGRMWTGVLHWQPNS